MKKLAKVKRTLLAIVMPGLLIVCFQNCAPGQMDYHYSPSDLEAMEKSEVNSVKFTCPMNYVLVPAMDGFTTSDFCVAKFEMKDSGRGLPVSQAKGLPWVNISRGVDSMEEGSAWKACNDLGDGFDLITNTQWQSIVKNISKTPVNWSGAVVNRGEMNHGHSDSSPAQVLEAYADNYPCFGTNEICTEVQWESQRRTHVLSNGSVIWDFSGNVWEWVQPDGSSIGGVNTNYKAVLRGGGYNEGVDATVFASKAENSADIEDQKYGFRCVYNQKVVVQNSGRL